MPQGLVVRVNACGLGGAKTATYKNSELACFVLQEGSQFLYVASARRGDASPTVLRFLCLYCVFDNDSRLAMHESQ